MNRTRVSATALMIMSIGLYAGGEIVPVEPQENILSADTKEDPKEFIGTVDGYVRAGYQQDGDSNSDIALGGKLHIETNAWYGLLAGASFYTTNQLGQNDGAGVPFFDVDNSSYSILGEVYLKGEWGNTVLKIGRQEIDTPFADTDDIGMVPNTFEAVLLVNRDISDTTILLAQVQKISGVDAEIPERFTRINGSNNVQVAGVTYEGIEGLALSGWYYNLKDYAIDSIAYIDANYERETEGFSYALGVQYASQNYSASGANTASIYGFSTSVGYAGVTLGAAYNKSNDNTADNGFGGGPFFTSAEHLTLAEAGSDGEALILSAELDAGKLGMKGVTLGIGKLTLTNASGTKSDELDITLNYTFNDHLTIDAAYSNVKDRINSDTFENTRIFLNYTF